MPQITINFDSKENKKIELFKAEHGLKNKANAVKKMVRVFFPKNVKLKKKQ